MKATFLVNGIECGKINVPTCKDVNLCKQTVLSILDATIGAGNYSVYGCDVNRDGNVYYISTRVGE